MVYLLGDIGGTNLRLCLYDDGKITREQVFSTTKYPRLEDAIAEFLDGTTATKCCLAIAGPVCSSGDHETVVLTNQTHQLTYDSGELAAHVGFPVKFINDFAAVGYYLSRERPSEAFRELTQENTLTRTGNGIVYLGAGTGLGVGYLYGKKVFVSEGGHTRFAPENEFELDFEEYYKRMVNSPEHLSNDRVISGHGIKWLWEFLVDTHKVVGSVLAANVELTQALGPQFSTEERAEPFMAIENAGDNHDAAAVISKMADAGNKQALAVMGLFFAWYGRFTADVCVTFCPDEIYLTSGIVLKNLPLLCAPSMLDVFVTSYTRKARLAHIPKATPLKVILDADCGFHGCAEAANILLQ